MVCLLIILISNFKLHVQQTNSVAFHGAIFDSIFITQLEFKTPRQYYYMTEDVTSDRNVNVLNVSWELFSRIARVWNRQT